VHVGPIATPFNLFIFSKYSALTHYRPVMPMGNRKIILEDLFSSVLLQSKKYDPSGNLKFNNLGISQSLKLRISAEKIPLISPELFTPNTLGSYGLIFFQIEF